MSSIATTNEIPAARQPWWSTLGWAAYLACSWTWCIGMFLPVLLVRDYGIWGFVVFAVPNVIGAGAMGWVLRDGVAERIVREHRVACDWFSRVTLLFQLVLLFALPNVIWGSGTALAPSRFMSILLVVPLFVCATYPRASAAIVWTVSLIVLTAAWRTMGYDISLPLSTPQTSGLAWLGLVCVFGFVFCPYLDHTFLLARIRQDHQRSKASFTLGFGVLFLMMILGTLTYAGPASELLEGREHLVGSVYVILLCVHIGLQLTATLAYHLEAMTGGEIFVRMYKSRVYAIMGGVLLIALLMTIAPGSAFGMTGWEIIYRCFMSFYGLVFPAYVWLCMIPTADGHSGITGARGRWKLGVCAAACVLAAPCYWMGFIERVEWWLAVGLGVVLVARVLVRGREGANGGVARAS